MDRASDRAPTPRPRSCDIHARISLTAIAEGKPGALRTARTDARGTFQIDQLAAGSYEARIRKSRFGRASQSGITVQPGSAIQLPVITMLPTASIRGRVNRTGIEEGSMRVHFEAIDGTDKRSTRVRRDRFGISDLQLGRYRLFVEHDGQRLPAGELNVDAPRLDDVTVTPQR